jgi:hypothetical protein
MRWHWRLRARTWGSVAAIAMLLVVAVFALFALFAVRRPAQAASSEYQQQLQALERVWTEGKQARKLLRSKNLHTDEPTCSKMYRATVASKFQWENQDLVAIGQEFFNQGCFGVGKPAPPELLAEQRNGL